MTNKRKIEILKWAKNVVSSLPAKRGRFGICWAVERQLTDKEFLKYDTYTSLRFLKILKPKGEVVDGFWFPLNKEGDKQRIKLINKAIKELSK